MSFEKKPNYKFEDLIEIMKLLRAPNGCLWDKEQTHKSIRQNFIEETYEVNGVWDPGRRSEWLGPAH